MTNQPSQALSRLEVPHSGYHWRGASWFSARRFFEGWYFRLTLPESGQTFAFMYSIDDPAGGTAHHGGAAQILGPNETYYCRTFPDVTQFWAWPHRLGLGHWRTSQVGRARYLSPAAFARKAFDDETLEGYQLTSEHHQGRLLNPAGQSSNVEAQWQYTVQPISGWGPAGVRSRATAGWLSYLPVFDPGWQVLMAHGLASGWMEWQGDRTHFQNAPVYAEKNWGTAFPAKWFWLQCNAFTGEPDLSITAAGGVRDVLTRSENVGLIGIHYRGQFYEFSSRETAFTWQVDPWGYWQMTAGCDRYHVELTGIAHDEGAQVRVPTQSGLQFLCRDTTKGELRVQLWEGDRVILDTTSQLAGLEIGGSPWEARWVSS
ncbi:MAG: tocopherol cyclase family protein [Phormidesmis sp.]